MTFTIPLFHGRDIFTYNIGLLPYRLAFFPVFISILIMHLIDYAVPNFLFFFVAYSVRDSVLVIDCHRMRERSTEDLLFRKV